ncbi:MAG: NAD(P)-dependent alcohol dehydrogenase [Pirellulales bacterium]|nr:NAD(P)-dependent alcohol dehydrogenase [Pirellulales bacterium]
MPPVTAAVVREKGGPWSLEPLELDEPRDDEVLVRIVATGVCHTDLSIRDQYLPLPLPIVLGHEGAGIVERTGGKVKNLAVGDHVVLVPLSCGACGNCQSGMQVYCDQFLRLNIGLRRPDGSATLRAGEKKVHGSFFGQSSFATHALAHERNAIRVPRDLPLELLGPLGCGVPTGAGTVMNALRPKPGASIAIFGAGTVGLSAIMAAKLVGCTTIIAIDRREIRLELARELGATHTIHNTTSDPVNAIRKLTGGRGANFTIDTTAAPQVMRQAVDCLAPPGTCAALGLAQAGAEFSLDINTLGQGRTIRGVTEGECVPNIMIPTLLELWQQGRFPFDRLIRKYAFQEINQAATDLASGAALKPVLVMG